MDRSEAGEALAALLSLMERLRDPQRGCPWDREQSFASIAPFTIEEAYEVREAIEHGGARELREELGDLLFQVVFHARLAEERGWFDFAAVARAIHEKLLRRHPHVFADGEQPADAAQQSLRWEQLKAGERSQQAQEQAGDPSALANVPLALPALMRAAKLGRRAAQVGFDWEHPGQVREKVLEELGEVDAALAGGPETAEVAEELGDLLFAVANWAVHLSIDPEEALRAANAKFELRFRCMEGLAGQRGRELAGLGAAEWDALWREAKRRR